MSAVAAVSLRIDFVSDVVCPWCAIGLASLEQALERVGDEVQAEIHFQPFELNPHMPPEGEDMVQHLQKKYGLSAAEIAANGAAIRDRGASLGFTFDMQRRDRMYNTFDAHRLLHWAGVEGGQRSLKHALLRAFFTEGRNVSDHGVLLDAVAQAGLPVERARAVLGSDEYAAEVRADEEFFIRNGIHGVPAIIFEQKHLLSGAQPVEAFEHALRQMIAAKQSGQD